MSFLSLTATHGTHVLVMANCTHFDFDTKTLRWYIESPTVTRDLLESRRIEPLPLNAQTLLDSDKMPPQILRWCSR